MTSLPSMLYWDHQHPACYVHLPLLQNSIPNAQFSLFLSSWVWARFPGFELSSSPRLRAPLHTLWTQNKKRIFPAPFAKKREVNRRHIPSHAKKLYMQITLYFANGHALHRYQVLFPGRSWGWHFSSYCPLYILAFVVTYVPGARKESLGVRRCLLKSLVERGGTRGDTCGKALQTQLIRPDSHWLQASVGRVVWENATYRPHLERFRSQCEMVAHQSLKATIGHFCGPGQRSTQAAVQILSEE